MAGEKLLIAGGFAALVAISVASSIAIARRPEAPPLPVVEAKPVSSGPRIALSPAQLKKALASGALDREVKSLLNVRKTMSHGDFQWNEAGVPDGPVWVRIDLGSQLISVFRAGHEIGTAVILFGADRYETPRGLFPVKWKRKDHRSATYGGAPMPYTLRLTDDGVAIHGSNVRWGAATHGCIGVPEEFARRLFDEVEVGDEVRIAGDATLRKSEARA